MSNIVETGGLQKHIIETLRPAYAHRYARAISVVQEHLIPLGITLPQTNRAVVGGLFIWLSLPEPLDADEIAARCLEEENVIIAQGSLFGVVGDATDPDLKRGIRICYSWEDEELLVEGIKKIGLVVRRKLEEHRRSIELGRADGRKAADVSSFK